MKILEQNEVVKIEYDEERSLFKHTWNDKSQNLDDELYKANVLFVNKWLPKIKTELHLIDTSNFRFVIPPDVQEWAAAKSFPILAAHKVRKMAFLLSHDLFAQVSLEQLVGENQFSDIEVMYFETEDAALEWLFN